MESVLMKRVPVLAIDAGGTSCRAALSNMDGHIVHYAEGGPCNYQSVGVKQARENLTGVLDQLKSVSGQGLWVEQAVIGIAGLDTEHDQLIIESFVKEAFRQANVQAATLVLNNDGMITLLGSIGEAPGLIVVSGTGSIVLGRTSDGRQTRVGGWGHRIGDDGSGHAIGQSALRHLIKAFDGCEPVSGLRDAILQELQLHTIPELMAWVYSDSYTVERVASLAPIVFRLAHSGDSAASAILERAGSDLACACATVIEQLGLEKAPFDMVIAGGILQKDTLVMNHMMDALTKNFKNFHVTHSYNEPIYSALLYGLRSLNCASEEVMANCAQELLKWQTQMKPVLSTDARQS
jgi:N-acetylglucosamine kinase-like BadF-type ATPase